MKVIHWHTWSATEARWQRPLDMVPTPESVWIDDAADVLPAEYGFSFAIG
jgi:hypothetical protein